MMRRLTTGLVIVWWVLLEAPASAAFQPAAIEVELDAAKMLYRDGRLKEAIEALRGVVVRLNDLQDVQDRTLRLADAHFHLGLAYLATRNESAAVESFHQVAALDPDRTLDPDIYYPRVLTVFARARLDVVKALTDVRRVPAIEEQPRPLEGTDLAPLRPRPTLLRILPGTKLRVERTDGVKSVGQLLAINEQVLTIGTEDWRLDLTREKLRRVHMVIARENHWVVGMLIGGGLGVLMGALDAGCGPDEICFT